MLTSWYSHKEYREQTAIEQWLHTALAVTGHNPDLAREILEWQGVLKGYGATYEHGTDSFHKLMDAARTSADQPDAADRLARLRAAALADEDGTALETERSAAIRPEQIVAG